MLTKEEKESMIDFDNLVNNAKKQAKESKLWQELNKEEFYEEATVTASIDLFLLLTMCVTSLQNKRIENLEIELEKLKQKEGQ